MKMFKHTVWSLGLVLALVLSMGAYDPSHGDTGTFPAVDDVWETGPYATTTITRTGPGRNYTVYRPEELGPNGLLNPIVIWGNGATTRNWMYPEYLPHFASHGFVVVAARNSFVSGDDLVEGLDWILEENQDPASEFYGKLDGNNICAMGYSLGSLATFDMANDPRLATTVHISGGAQGDDSVRNLRNAAAFFCDEDTTAPNCQDDFDVASVPVFYGVFGRAGHVGTMRDPFSSLVAGATVGWLRWHLMSDETQMELFVGDDCTLCLDDDWADVQQKDLE